MIILSKRVGQVSSNQPLGVENNGPQDSRLIVLYVWLTVYHDWNVCYYGGPMLI